MESTYYKEYISNPISRKKYDQKAVLCVVDPIIKYIYSLLSRQEKVSFPVCSVVSWKNGQYILSSDIHYSFKTVQLVYCQQKIYSINRVLKAFMGCINNVKTIKICFCSTPKIKAETFLDNCFTPFLSVYKIFERAPINVNLLILRGHLLVHDA